MLMMKAGVFRPAKLVSLRKIESEVFRHRGRRRRAAHRRDDDAGGAGALGRSAASIAPLITRTHADAVERARAQRRDRRRRARARRSAHGPAAGADGARRDAHGHRARRASARVAVEDLFAGYYETVLEKNELIAEVHVPAQGTQARRLHEGHHRLGRRLAGARRRGRDRSRRQARSSRRASWSAPRPTRRRGSNRRKRCSPARPSTTSCSAQAGDAAAEEAEFIADVRGSVPYKRELMRVYVRRAVRAGARRKRSALMATTLNDAPPRSARRSAARCRGSKARDKVTGRAEYTHTMRLPGMLHAKMFRSTVAHGRIKSIDTSAAKKLPGVLHVVTIDDVMKVIPDPVLRPGVPRPADPGAREGALRRRAGRRRARRRSARRRGGGAAHRRRIRGAAGGLSTRSRR